VIERLTGDVAHRCERQVPDAWLWKGRHVKLADGTTVTMADTEENQQAFPQHSCQQEGLGFPIARLVVLLSLATAMTMGMAMARYRGKETGELALLRELFDQLDPHDVLLADRLYCTYFTLAMLSERQVDMVVRLHHLRRENVARTQRLGKGDSLITWPKPDCPAWMDKETYARMPEFLQLRLIHVHVDEPGFRTESIDIVTTLTDTELTNREEIAELYHARWLAELDIRAIKCTMGMDALRCKSPEMVRKEIWTCLLAYNMIRQKILQSALEHDISPRAMCFTNALQMITAAWMVMPLLNAQTSRVLRTTELEKMEADNHEVDGAMRRFASWRSLTRTQRYTAQHHTTGQGHLYQDRYKSFPVQGDDPFLSVCHYVERNAYTTDNRSRGGRGSKGKRRGQAHFPDLTFF